MAVVPTGEIFKTLTFDGQSSGDYGVYITGEAVYNAPARDVEMVTIPGRNGQFALDKGRFENIEVSYPAGIFADNEADFAQAVSDFRNFLASRSGYCRLEDDYNPNEYRMAVYKSGMEVDPKLLRAGEFNIVFDCKPQRWLTSGETEVSVTSGDTLTNPTLFESSPLLEVEGYGNIGFNGYEMELENVELGEVQISTAHNHTSSATVTLDTQLINNSDAIYTQNKMLVRQNLKASTGYNAIISNAIVTSTTNATEATAKPASHGQHLEMSFRADWGDGFVYGTSKTVTSTVTITASVRVGDTSYSATITISFVTAYNGTDRVTCTKSVTWTGTGGNYLSNMTTSSTIPVFYGDSSESALGHPTYIDCDLGECYLINDGKIVSLNQHIDLGSKLPTLASGNNTITYDNTITDLKIQPRWWKV